MLRKKYIPTGGAAFFGFQGNLVNRVVINAVAWVIPAPAVTALVTRRAEYEPLFVTAQNMTTRRQADVVAYRECRKVYEKEIRVFAKAYLMFNPLVTDQQRSEMALTIPDRELTPRGAIDSKPYVDLEPLGGGSISVRVRVTTDRTRASMHPLADAIECRYTFVPVGEMQPEDWDACPKTAVSKKALFKISCGAKAIGQRFYGFFRWVNESNPAHNSDWTNAINVVIA